jgi:Flp pilus assembly protein TadD
MIFLRTSLVGALLIASMSACGGAQANRAQTDAIINEDSPYAFHRALANTLLRTQQYKRAMPHVRAMTKMRPNLPEPFYLMGKVYQGMGLYEPAARVLEESLERSPSFVPAISSLGILYDSMGRHEDAEKWHRKALEIDATKVSFYNNLGFCLYLQKRYEDAVEVYMQALEKQAGSRRLLNNLGFAYGQLGRMDEAYRHFRAAGTEADAANNMGILHELRGELEPAYESFSEAVVADKGLTAARINLKRVCKRLNRPVPEFARVSTEEGEQ